MRFIPAGRNFMQVSAAHHHPLGNTGLQVPPVMFGTRALGNIPRVLPAQTKVQICGEWFRNVAPPVLIDVSFNLAAGNSLELLDRALTRYEISSDDFLICNRLACSGDRLDRAAMQHRWDEDCRLLGNRSPQLAAISDHDVYLAAADSAAERDRRMAEILDAHRTLCEWKAAGTVSAIGTVVRDWRLANHIASEVDLDWIMLDGCLSLLSHPPDLLEFLAVLAKRLIAVIAASVFHDGFLTGGAQISGRDLNPDDPADQQRLSWRKAFVALCQGHGIVPAHACIQFCLVAPGVVSTAVEPSHPDEIAEFAQYAVTEIPPAFWESIKEELLLAEDYAHLPR